MSYAAYPVRPDLGLAALSFSTETDVFVADDVLPPLEVDSQSAAFERYGVEVGTQLPADNKRATGAGFVEVTYGKTEDYYSTHEYGQQDYIDLKQEYTAERFQREEINKATRLARMTMAMHERRVVAATVSSAAFANGTDFGANVSAVWSSSGTPIDDIELAIQKVIDQSGTYPNLLVLPRDAWSEASRNTNVTARLRTDVDNAGLIPLKRLQEIFGITKIVVPHSMYNSAPNGAAPVLGKIWPKTKVLVAHVRTDPTVEPVQLGRTMVWDAPGYSGGMGSTVSWQNHPRRVEYAHFQNVGEKILSPECAYVLHTVL